MPREPDCNNLGLDEAELASLTGFTYRAAQMLAHLREVWLVADRRNARAVERALAALFEAHSIADNRELFARVLCHSHERGEELLKSLDPEKKSTRAQGHTPGPWWHAENAKREWDIGAGDEVIATCKRQPISFGFKADGDDKANARLIAAAPELLEALERASVIVHSHHDAWWEKCSAPECVANRAALKKARGES